MKAVRRQTDGVYAEVVERVNAAIVLNGEKLYAPFVNELNAFIKHYNNILAQRLAEKK
jgi:hypothetical protein